MASVLKVYNALKDISNKEQKGFITPAVFNSFAHIAQMNVYNELFDDFIKAKGLMRQSMDLGRDRSPRKLSSEDVSMYIREEALVQVDGNRFQKPSNLGKVISIRTVGEPGSSENRVSCEMLYDAERINAILGSNLSTPTEDFPVALVSKDIEIFPDTVGDAFITYYCTPSSMTYGTQTPDSSNRQPQIVFQSGSSGVVDPINSRDFMIPVEFLPELVFELCELTGVRLRDQNLQGFGARKEAAE